MWFENVNDLVGDACDICPSDPDPGQQDFDLDDVGDACDICPDDFDPGQEDSDLDWFGDACDNCPSVRNPNQTDLDDDLEGDSCDLDDGLIYVQAITDVVTEWQNEAGFDSWNWYKGDLALLVSSGEYTQLPDASNPLADRQCGLLVPAATDAGASPSAGRVAFYLVAGVSGGVEGTLGSDSTGSERPNDNPCP